MAPITRFTYGTLFNRLIIINTIGINNTNNNMHNGIYLDYLLSFSVTYEVSTREKIIERKDL